MMAVTLGEGIRIAGRASAVSSASVEAPERQTIRSAAAMTTGMS
jgi:hypothetical protein